MFDPERTADLVKKIHDLRGDVLGALAEQLIEGIPMHKCSLHKCEGSQSGECRSMTRRLAKRSLEALLLHRGYLRDVTRGPVIQCFFTELMITAEPGIIARSDVNNLKGINQALGRTEADQILALVAKYHIQVYSRLDGLVFFVHSNGDEVDIFASSCNKERFLEAEAEVRSMVDKLGREPFGSRGVILTDIVNPRCRDNPTEGRFGLRTAVHSMTKEDLIARCFGNYDSREERRFIQEISDGLDDGLESAKKPRQISS